VAWSAANGIRLDLVFNGQGATQAAAGQGVKKGQQDELTKAALAAKSSFGWISHTWSHEDLDSANLSTITSEIKKNVDWANANHVAINPAEVVTGGHTGLSNPAMPTALARTGVTRFASDASNPQWANVQPLGPALIVPRHPTDLFYNVGTRAEQLDEFNWIYRDDPWVNAPVTWDRYVEITSGFMLEAMMGNDPRPHFAHQNNLAEDGTFYDVADALLARYCAWFSVPLIQPTMTESGTLLATMAAWTTALAGGQVSAFVQSGMVHVQTTAQVSVPLTGTTSGSLYGGLRSGWVNVSPASPLTVAVAPTRHPAAPRPLAHPGSAIEGLLLGSLEGEGGFDQLDRLAELGRLGAQFVLQRAVEDELAAFLHRARYERSPYAAGSRNGHRARSIQTAEGPLTIAMPQVRDTLTRFVSSVIVDTRSIVRTRSRGLAVVLPTRVPRRPPGPAWERRDPVLARARARVHADLNRLVVLGSDRGCRDVPLEAPRPACEGHAPPAGAQGEPWS
jgi:hypothetical protein